MKIIYRCAELETTINYRPKGTVPDWIDKRKCFKSLLNSIQYSSINTLIHIVHDGNSGILEEYIKSYKNQNIIFQKINNKSNALSYNLCLQLAKQYDDDVYLLEDDYLHLPNAIKIIHEGVKKFGLVTGYDHPDRYTRIDDITYKNEEVNITNSSHWRTAEATTCTWASSKEIFNIIFQEAINYGIEDRSFFRFIFNNKKIRLWQPLPGVSTHLANPFFSPLIDWKFFNDSIIL